MLIYNAMECVVGFSPMMAHIRSPAAVSENSLASNWFRIEVKAALDKEKNEELQVLFPVCLDTTYMESPHQWVTDLRQTHHIYDFTQWENDEEYRKGFDQLLSDVLRS